MLLINMEAGTVQAPRFFTQSPYREVEAVDETEAWQGRQAGEQVLSVTKKQTSFGFSNILAEEEAKF